MIDLFLALLLTSAPRLQDAPAEALPRALDPVRAAALGVERALAAHVSEQRAQQRVRELCAFGPRMGGTESGARAAAFLAERFREAGLEARVVLDSELWCHAETSWSVRVIDGEDETALASAWPYGFSPTSAGRAPLALTAAPGGVLLTERPPRGRSARAALVLVDGASTEDGRYPQLRHLRPPREGEGAPTPVFGLGARDGARLRERLAAGAALEVAWELEADIRRDRPRTVVARLPARDRGAPGAPVDPDGAAEGSAAPESGAAQDAPWDADHFLFCAHGDSDAGGPGADDNASGAAVVLEVATAWRAAIASGEVAAPPFEVRFAVWGSEIHSTRDYHARSPGQGRVLGVVNFDQAGFGSGADQLNIEPDDVPANVALVRALLGVLSEHAGAEGFPARYATNKSLGGTDSYVFSGSDDFRERGAPALTVFTSAWDRPAEHPRTPGMPGESWSERDVVRVDYDAYYHSAGDTPENTTDKEPWNMGWCARVALLGARRYLEDLARPPAAR